MTTPASERAVAASATSGENLSFLRIQLRRALLRGIVLFYAVLMLAFWTFAIALLAWLRARDLGVIQFLLGVVYAYFVLPSLVVQLSVMVDLLAYIATGKTKMFQYWRRTADHEEMQRRYEQLTPGVRRYLDVFGPAFRFAGSVSPLIALELWAWVVLYRLPERAHSTAPITRTELRRALAFGRDVERSIVEDFAERQFFRVA
jgi:hypothetical protein